MLIVNLEKLIILHGLGFCLRLGKIQYFGFVDLYFREGGYQYFTFHVQNSHIHLGNVL